MIAIHAEPDGLNINDGCGSTHLGPLQAAVVEHGADAGFALDGDADRCLAVDHEGNVVDGDQILAILALGTAETRPAGQEHRRRHRDEQPRLRAGDAAPPGIGVRQTKVGDRYVLEAMRVAGYSLGGEQSGHVIMSDHATTGDGILTALHVLERMAATGQSLAGAGSVMTRLPQVLVNVPDVDKARADEDAVAGGRGRRGGGGLGDTGRVLLRPSGTEPLVRVMVEAATARRGPGGRRAARRRRTAPAGPLSAATGRSGPRRRRGARERAPIPWSIPDGPLATRGAVRPATRPRSVRRGLAGLGGRARAAAGCPHGRPA